MLLVFVSRCRAVGARIRGAASRASEVIEIIIGVVVGSSVLGRVQIDLPAQILAIFRLAFLLLLAGSEIDLQGLRGNLLNALVGIDAHLLLRAAKRQDTLIAAPTAFATSGVISVIPCAEEA